MAKLNRNQKCLFSIHLLRGIMELFTNTFLTSHIISITAENVLSEGLFNSAIFYIAQYVLYAVFYFFISFFVKRSNRTIFLQLGIILNLALIVCLVFLSDVISSWIILVGSLCGISNALYYASYFVMKNEFASRKSIKKYNIFTVMGVNVVKVVVPTLLGFLIDSSSFANISIYMTIITVAQLIISFFIISHKRKGAKLQLLSFYKALREDTKARKKIKYTYINAVLSGIKNTYKLLLTVLILFAYKTNFGLRLFTSIFSLVTMGLLVLFKVFDNRPKTNKFAIYLVIGLLPLASSLFMVFWLNEITLIMFNFFLTVAIYFSDYFGSSERDAIIKHIGKREYIAEHQLSIEIITCTSRVLSYFVMLLMGFVASLIVFKILLVAFMALCPVKYMVMYKQRKIRKEFELLQERELVESAKLEQQPA